MKRVSQLWGKRFHKGFILWKPRLQEALRLSDYVEFGKVTVTTKDLRQVLTEVTTEDILLRSSGGLEIEAVERYTRVNPDDPRIRQLAHRLGKNGVTHYIRNRKKTDGVGVILKIKIRPYGRKRKVKKELEGAHGR